MSDSGSAGSVVKRHAVVAMDKFRGSADAMQMNEAVARGLESCGWLVTTRLISDGGEGFRNCFEGDVVSIMAPDAYGTMHPVPITISLINEKRVAVLEAAEIVGYTKLAPTSREAIEASSSGVGIALLEAEKLSISSVLIGLGGSSTSDGGLGCFEILQGKKLPFDIVVATDIRASFSGAIKYAKQKGVAEDDLWKIEDRLSQLSKFYSDECKVDVELIEGTGAAGGIGGALAALGAELRDGYAIVAEATGFDSLVQSAGLVVTGEGRFDFGSLEGKVVSGICSSSNATPVVVLCGEYESEAVKLFSLKYPKARIASFTERFGIERSLNFPALCAEEIVKELQ